MPSVVKITDLENEVQKLARNKKTDKISGRAYRSF